MCYDCARPYGDEHGFPDLVIPHHIWRRISPSGDENGLLCPSCICRRLHKARIVCAGSFLSGPIRSVSPDLMSVLCHVEVLWSTDMGRTTPCEDEDDT